jgi:DNA-binding IclR family transcriptional regulator
MIEQLAQDTRLSFEARGAMLYILSMGEGARFTPADLMREGKLGRNRAYRLLKQLRTAGYIEYVQKRRGGYYSQTNWTVCKLSPLNVA